MSREQRCGLRGRTGVRVRQALADEHIECGEVRRPCNKLQQRRRIARKQRRSDQLLATNWIPTNQIAQQAGMRVTPASGRIVRTSDWSSVPATSATNPGALAVNSSCRRMGSPLLKDVRLPSRRSVACTGAGTGGRCADIGELAISASVAILQRRPTGVVYAVPHSVRSARLRNPEWPYAAEPRTL